jgi:AcrR family transcriptional regulator
MRTTARSRSADGPVGEIQRGRLLAAMAAACVERAPSEVTVTEVIAGAHVSRRTFYEFFECREDCLLAAQEEALQRAGARVLPAYEQQERWQQAVRAGLEAFLDFLDEDRAFGGLLLFASLAAGLQAQSPLLAKAITAVVSAIDEGRKLLRAPAHLSATTAEGVLGAALFILSRRLMVEARVLVSPLAGDLAALIFTPYLGGAAAGRQLSRPAPARRGQARVDDGADAFDGLQIRITHRTMLVLDVVGSHPGVCNREVAQLSGISDQGQASRLLLRLTRLGLIESPNNGLGKPHAWKLTRRGREARQALDGWSHRLP